MLLRLAAEYDKLGDLAAQRCNTYFGGSAAKCCSRSSTSEAISSHKSARSRYINRISGSGAKRAASSHS